MEAHQILKEARRCKDERFSMRDKMLQEKRRYRFGRDTVDVPKAYKKTTQVYHAPHVREEGRQVFALIKADAVPHITPPTPEDQPLSTKIEQWLMALFQELESSNGAVDDMCAMAQIHDAAGWIYFAPKRKPYDGQPSAPDDDTYESMLSYGEQNARFKKDAGANAAFDYFHAPTDTVFAKGDPWNPTCVYVIKDVDADEVALTYGLKFEDGRWNKKPDAISLPGVATDSAASTRNMPNRIQVVEYWDRNTCKIVLENGASKFMRGFQSDPFILDEWTHNWGRVPYFIRPAFQNEVAEEEYRFESPLDGVYAEIGYYNLVRTMMAAVAYNTAFAPLKVITKEGGDLILDDSGQPKTFLEFVPGEARQMAPGQDALPMPLSPEVAILAGEVASVEARIRQFSLSDISKGISPGADTANSALSQLRRLVRASLQPLSENAARQWREIFKFALARLRSDIGETVYVFNRDGVEFDLSPEDVITLNVQVRVDPDTGSDKLIEEKQAAELTLQGLITEIEFHERRGKENPEAFAIANAAQRLYRTIEPQVQTQFLAALGDTQAITQMILASQEQGDAKAAIPGILEQMAAAQNGETGVMGSGSGGMPREMGVRSPNVQPTTQPSVPGSFDA